MTTADTTRESRIMRAGLAGYPVSHSLSPRLFAAAATQCGIECSYELLPFADESEFQHFAKSAGEAGYSGVNVTTPYKDAAYRLGTRHCEAAALTQSVNLLRFLEDGQVHAANTDVHGFSLALTEMHGFDPAGKRAVILGSGSVARSVLLALSRLHCKRVMVAGRSQASLQRFADMTTDCAGAMTVDQALIDSDEMQAALANADLLVNCTSAGMTGSEDESPLGGFYRCHPQLLAIDLIYLPRVTRFMAQMRNCGARAENGLGMLVCQASVAFELLSGHRVDPQMLLTAAGRR